MVQLVEADAREDFNLSTIVVSPAFDVANVISAKRQDLVSSFPSFEDIIVKYTLN